MPQAPCTPRRAGDSARHPDHPACPPRPQTATQAGHGTTAREPTCPLWQRLARHAWDDPQDARPFSARLRHTTGWSAAHTQRVLVEYRRFLYLAVRRRGRVCPSGAVDEAWHAHLLDTPRYFGAFCPQVLGTTLHHVPDRGSGTRDDARQYRATLRAYRWVFGEVPPADIWPAPAQRWAELRRHVDLRSHWLLPRPGHAGRAMGRAACGIWQALTQVNARAVRPWAMALILPLVLTLGCTQGRISIQPDVSGAAFLKGYFWTLVALLAVGIWRSARGRPSAQEPVRATRLNPIDVAYLNGGALRAVVTALARQWQREAIAPIAESPDRSAHYVLPWRVVGAPDAAQPLHPAADTSALERATLQALGERRTPAALLAALQAPLDELHARLYAQGWLSTSQCTARAVGRAPVRAGLAHLAHAHATPAQRRRPALHRPVVRRPAGGRPARGPRPAAWAACCAAGGHADRGDAAGAAHAPPAAAPPQPGGPRRAAAGPAPTGQAQRDGPERPVAGAGRGCVRPRRPGANLAAPARQRRPAATARRGRQRLRQHGLRRGQQLRGWRRRL